MLAFLAVRCCGLSRSSRDTDPPKKCKITGDTAEGPGPPTAIVAGALERSAADAREPAEQSDNENDQDNRSNRHAESPPACDLPSGRNKSCPGSFLLFASACRAVFSEKCGTTSRYTRAYFRRGSRRCQHI